MLVSAAAPPACLLLLLPQARALQAKQRGVAATKTKNHSLAVKEYTCAAFPPALGPQAALV